MPSAQGSIFRPSLEPGWACRLSPRCALKGLGLGAYYRHCISHAAHDENMDPGRRQPAGAGRWQAVGRFSTSEREMTFEIVRLIYT